MKKGTTATTATPEAEESAAAKPTDKASKSKSSSKKSSSRKSASKKGASKKVAKLTRELAEKTAEADVLTGRLLRLQADFDNFRKRVIREKEALRQRAHAELLEDVLPMIDHLELALTAARDHDAPEAFVEGFQLVQEQIISVLEQYDLSPMQCDGEEFDPNHHEAIAHTPSEDVAENHVILQTRRGYMIGDRLLRAAQVVVSSGPATAAAEASETANGDEAEKSEA